MRDRTLTVIGALLLVLSPAAALARSNPHSPSCAEAARTWQAKVATARGGPAAVALSRRLASQAQLLCRSHDPRAQAQGAQVYQRAVLACDGGSKDPAYRRY